MSNSPKEYHDTKAFPPTKCRTRIEADQRGDATMLILHDQFDALDGPTRLLNPDPNAAGAARVADLRCRRQIFMSSVIKQDAELPRTCYVIGIEIRGIPR